MTTPTIAIVYMGGTFGCTGEPLAPLPASQFLNHLQQLDLSEFQADIQFFVAPSIADSSAYTATDWFKLVHFLDDLVHTHHIHKVVIIHGTDTLSYASAVISRFLSTPCTVVFTGSQLPLLNVNGTALRSYSDALPNLKLAITQALKPNLGVFLAFGEHCLPANSTLKSHSTEFSAFHHQQRLDYSPHFFARQIKITPTDIEKIASCSILSVMIQPLALEHLQQQLQLLSQKPPHFLILKAFGVGNLSVNEAIIAHMKQLAQLGCLIIISTQVPFGAIQQDYAISDWIASSPVCLDNTASDADLYAKLLQLYLDCPDVQQRYQQWSK